MSAHFTIILFTLHCMYLIIMTNSVHHEQERFLIKVALSISTRIKGYDHVHAMLDIWSKNLLSSMCAIPAVIFRLDHPPLRTSSLDLN